MAFHESRVVLIETGRRVIHAGLGLGEYLHVPSVELLARVGLRRSHFPANLASPANGWSTPEPPTGTRVSDYLVGHFLDEALASGEEIFVYWPFLEAQINNWNQAEALWKHILFKRLGIRRQLNECPVLLSLPAGLSRMSSLLLCRMFFERFNVAGYTFIERPLAALYAANLTSGCVIEIGQDETDLIPIADSVLYPGSGLSIPIGIRGCERYLASILRSNTSVMNTFGQAGVTDPVELEKHLVGVARALWKQGKIKVPLEGEPEVEEEGVLDIAAILVSGKERAVLENAQRRGKPTFAQTKAEKEREKELAALDLIPIQYGEFGTITVGKERHRFCEPLFEPGLLFNLGTFGEEGQRRLDGSNLPPKQPVNKPETIMALPNAISLISEARPWYDRPHMYVGLVLTGEIADIQGLHGALQSRVGMFLAKDLNPEGDPILNHQPQRAKVVKVPEYFGEFRDKGDLLASFLGCGIIAKLTFGDNSGKNYVSKATYGEKGPQALLEAAASIF